MKNQQAQVFPEMGLNQDILYMPIPPPKVRYYSARAVRSNPQRWKFPKSKQSLPIPAEKYGDSRNHRSVAMARLNFILFLNFFSHLESWFPMVPHGSPWFPMVPHGFVWFPELIDSPSAPGTITGQSFEDVRPLPHSISRLGMYCHLAELW